VVRGLDVFREYFAGHADQFVLIGGTAATLAMEEAGLEFRATKDLDIVLHIEALSPAFGEVFWSFIETGEARSEPWSALLRFGAELVSALTMSEDGVVAAHPWVERDPATGARSLKVPLPPPETIRRIADALSTISNALLSAGGKEETR